MVCAASDRADCGAPLGNQRGRLAAVEISIYRNGFDVRFLLFGNSRPADVRNSGAKERVCRMHTLATLTNASLRIPMILARVYRGARRSGYLIPGIGDAPQGALGEGRRSRLLVRIDLTKP